MSQSNNIHLNLSKRQIIENLLIDHKSATEIARVLNVHKSTISREIFKYRTLYYVGDKSDSICSHCLNAASCKLKHRCGRELCSLLCRGCSTLKKGEFCDTYQPLHCKIETRFPFVCSACRLVQMCKRNHYRYVAKEADKIASHIKKESRIGLDMTPEDFARIDQIVKEGLANNQSIYHISKAFKNEINRTPKTLYSYINRNFLSSIRLDLPRAVTYKTRSKSPQKYDYKENRKIDRTNHMYRDWLVFQSTHRIIDFWEMDFLGAPHASEQQILVLTIPRLQFILFFPLSNAIQKLVLETLDRIYYELGPDFIRVFPVILTDRDPAFNDFVALETDAQTGEIRTNIFYCDPNVSNQKPSVENVNGQIRTIFPKGVCLSNITLEQCYRLSSHYNARILHSLNDATPASLFIDIFGLEVFRKLHLEIVEPTKVSLKRPS